MNSNFDTNSKFSVYFKKFLALIAKNTGHEGAKKVLNNYDSLNIEKAVNFFEKSIGDLDEEIENKNIEIFNQPLVVFPTIDISKIYDILKEDEKSLNKFWNYLKFLSTLVVLKNKHIKALEKFKKITTDEEEFNPFVGIKGQKMGLKSLQNTNLAEIQNLIPELKKSSNSEQMEMLMSLMNPKMLLSKLQGVSKEELQKGLDDMKKHIGELKKDTKNNKIIKMIEKMFDNLSETLLSGDLENVDLFETIKNASSNMNEEDTIGDTDMKDLMDMASSVAGQMSNMDGPNDDPMLKQVKNMLPMFQQMMSNMNDKNNKDKK